MTGDQTTNVSGTQTTTATDINRNASSSMVDKVDNAYGTNTETKETQEIPLLMSASKEQEKKESTSEVLMNPEITSSKIL